MKRVTSFAVAVCAVALMGERVFASDASQIELKPVNSLVTYDNSLFVGYDGNGYPVITAVASAPGTFGGHNFTGWSLLAQDMSGSIDIFTSVATLAVIGGGYTTPTVGDGISAQGQWQPYHQIPEMSFSTVASSNNFIAHQSSGNALPAVPTFTVSQLNVGTLPDGVPGVGIAGYFVEIQNATISGGGAYSTFFPNYSQGNVSYTISDGSGSMTMYDWVTSYSYAAGLGGTQVPTGPTNLFGFVSVYTSGAAYTSEFIPVMATIPEPSSIMLLGAGLLGLLAIRRRRS